MRLPYSIVIVLPLYKEASYKPYIIAAMILLAKQQCPQETLKKLAEKATERHMA